MDRASRLQRACLAALLVFACSVDSGRAAPAIDVGVRNTLAAPRSLCPPANVAERQQLEAAYSGDAHTFGVSRGPTANAVALIDVLRQADDFGLRPVDYCSSALAARAQELAMGSQSTEGVAQFEAGLSMASLRMLTHLLRGRVVPREAGFDLLYSSRRSRSIGGVRSEERAH